MKRFKIIIGLLLGVIVVVLASLLFLVFGWSFAEQLKMSLHGYIAFSLGVALTVIVGGGLMFLVIYSNRRGYDDLEH